MKKYNVGYVAGVFDLFHIGHLNLIRKSKDLSEFLIVGVLTDDLVAANKGSAPYIPFEERCEIVRAIRYVDEVVPVTADNIEKLRAWELYHFDCLFSGDDYVHSEYWIEDKKKLNGLGANIEFFPYTKSTSSTQIKAAIQKRS